MRAIADGKTIQQLIGAKIKKGHTVTTYWRDMLPYKALELCCDAEEESIPMSHLRVKPETRPDFVGFSHVSVAITESAPLVAIVCNAYTHKAADSNLMLTFDGETGILKSAEVLS